MENFTLSFKVICPLVILLAVGYLLRRLKWIDEKTISQMHGITFRVFLPLMLYINIYNSSLRENFNGRLLLYAAVISTISFAFAFIIACMVEPDKKKRAAMAQGMFRNNYIVYGTAIISTVYDSSAQGLIFMLIACIIPLNNIYSVIAIKLITSEKVRPVSMIWSILKNPYVIASALGFLTILLDISLPYMITKPLQDLGNMATPISMLLLGAGLRFSEVGSYKKDIIIGVLCKLVLLPAVFLPVLIWMGIRGEALLVLLTAVCTPAAAGSHVVAREMGADGTLAGHLVVFGTVFSCVTIFFWIWLLNCMQLL